MMRSARPFPYWVSFAVWLFLGLALIVGAGVGALAALGLHPDPLAAFVGVDLPLFAAALFLWQDWRWHREDTRGRR